MTSRQPTPSAQFTAFLSRFPPEVIALVKRCLPKLRRAMPGATQLVYDYRESVVVGFGVSERGNEAAVALAISAGRVQLYVPKSTPDPKKLLKGAGAKVRSVEFKSASDLERGDVCNLFKAAIVKSGVKFSKDGSPRMIIKAAAKSRPPRKARGA